MAGSLFSATFTKKPTANAYPCARRGNLKFKKSARCQAAGSLNTRRSRRFSTGINSNPLFSAKTRAARAKIPAGLPETQNMKTLVFTFADFAKLRNADRTVRAPHDFDPSRTAFRCSGEWNYIFQEWPSREAWSKAYAAQARSLQKRQSKDTDWIPVHPQN